MEKKETVTANPLGMCERLYHAFTNSHSLLPFRRPHQTSGSSVPVTEERPKNSGHAQPQACGTAPTAKVGLNTNQEKAIAPEKEKQAAKVVERVPQQRTAPPVATGKAAAPVMPTIAAEKGKAEAPALPPTATEKGKTAPPAVTTVALEKGKAASMVLPTEATEKDKAAAAMATAPTMEKGKAEPPVRSITNINDTSENYIRRARNSMRTISSVGGAQK